MRVDEAEISRKIFEALGACPVAVSFYDVADALKNNRVHAAENAPFNMIALGWHAKCKYVSRTGHRFLLNFELASEAFWQELDNNTKASVKVAFASYLENFANLSDSERSSSLNSLSVDHGLTVNEVSQEEIEVLRISSECVITEYASLHDLRREIEWIREN